MLALMLSLATGTAVVADHEASVDLDALVWQSRIVTEGGGVVSLRRPLAPHVEVKASVPLQRDNEGRVQGFVTPPARQIVEVTVRQPRTDVVLAAPLVPAIERVTFVAGVRFTPDTDLGIEQRVRRFATPDVRRDDDDLVRAFFPRRLRSDSLPLYLGRDATPAIRARGLSGSVVDVDAQKWNVALALLVASIGLVGLLALAARALARRAASERAERILEQEWGSL